MISANQEACLPPLERAGELLTLNADLELARGVARGDVDCLHRFLHCYRPRVFRYLWQASGSYEDAEDLASQTLLVAAREIARYRNQGQLQAWVFRIAQRELLRFRRRQSLAHLWSSRKQEESLTHPPDDYLVVCEALTKLPIEQRTAFLLTEVEGLTFEEASEVLKTPIGTVKSRSHAARQRLRTLLAPTYQESLR
jgi:RNA polymerase sigma-70 factor (ECF subfamily)